MGLRQPVIQRGAISMGNKIITYVSLLNDKREPELYYYAYPANDPRRKAGAMLSGRQTNEAPLKYFLSSEPYPFSKSDQILCLCTREVTETIIPWPWAQSSTYDYFEKSIKEFCSEAGHECPNFKRVIIDTQEPDLELALAEIMQFIKRGDQVYLDATGGPRDASFIVVLLLQALEFRGAQVKEIVYSYFSREKPEDNSIRRLDDISRILRIINALSEFTNYGRTRLFSEMTQEELGKDVSALVSRLTEFSNALEVSSFTTENQGPDFDRILTGINSALENCKNSKNVRPLMKQLLPVFREKMTFGENGFSLASVVQWCAENQLLQQGATIFNENVIYTLRSGGILTLRNPPPSKETMTYPLTISKVFVRMCAAESFRIPADHNPEAKAFQAGLVDRREEYRDYCSAGSVWETPSEVLKGAELADCAFRLILSCFFRDDLSCREIGDIAARAIDLNYPELLPLLAKEGKALRKTGIKVKKGKAGMEEFCRQWAAQRYRNAIAEIMTAISLRSSGFAGRAKQILSAFQGKEKMPAEYGSMLSSSDIGCISNYSKNVSKADLGLIFVYYPIIRLIRNQMSHSIIYDDSQSSEVLSCLEKMGVSDIVVKLPMQDVQETLLAAAGCLGRLERQIAAARELL